jgi:3-hydroxyisobutyrate dehydrogenase
MTDSQRRVGVIGLGRIGAPVVRSLVDAGHAVAVYDARLEAATALTGVTVCDGPRAVSDAAEIVLVAVFDDAQVRDVLDGPSGILGAQHPPNTVCILSTITLETLRWAVATGLTAGVNVLDCGVTGGGRLRSEGKIVVLAGGDESALEFARPVLEAFADPLLYMGRSGAGMAAKLSRNLMHYSAWYASWEGARLAAEAGVDVMKLAQAHRISNQSGGPTSLLEGGIGPGLDSDIAATMERRRFSTEVAKKDLGYAIELAHELGIPVPGAELTRASMDAVVGLAPAEPSAAVSQ